MDGCDDVTELDGDAFNAHVRATAAAAEQCVLVAATPHGILNLWQGSFKLIETDLALTLGSMAKQSVHVLRSAGVFEAYALRRELVNMKKACLRLFHDVERLVHELKRQDQYFFCLLYTSPSPRDS